MGKKAKKIWDVLASTFDGVHVSKMPDVDKILNSKKVSDHHAIIPTELIQDANLQELPEGERQILKLVAVRFVESVSDPATDRVSGQEEFS